MSQDYSSQGSTVTYDATFAAPPRKYKVILLNDDYTTMDFVVMVLQKIFHKSADEAVKIMLLVHQKGMGVAGVYVKDIAEMKSDAVHKMAQSHGFPLRCAVEPE